MIYIGTTSNSEFSGPESIEELASRIAVAVGKYTWISLVIDDVYPS
jgi:cation transport regulator ChaC